ncbi:MAG: hypothetical protein KC503_40930 [Myxococcales bacterium]|nr:hypothetical protein [Myxococcales bacterium]
MFWDTHDESDPRIVRRYGWMAIGGLSARGHVAARVEGEESGVYVVADAAMRVSYVGHAEPGRLRAELLWALRRRKADEGMQVLWLVTATVDDAKAIKRYLLRRYQPPRNQAVKVGKRPTDTLSYREGQQARRSRVLGDTTSEVPLVQVPREQLQRRRTGQILVPISNPTPTPA